MSRKLPWSWLNLFLQFSCPCQLTSLLRLFLLEDLEHIGVSFPCDSLQLLVPSFEVVVGVLGLLIRKAHPHVLNLPLLLFICIIYVLLPSMHSFLLSPSHSPGTSLLFSHLFALVKDIQPADSNTKKILTRVHDDVIQ